jgi:hypothetical protein
LCALAKTVATTALNLAEVEINVDVDDALSCTYVAELIQSIGVDRAMSAGDEKAKIGSLFVQSSDPAVKNPMARYVGVYNPGSIGLHEQNFFFQMAYALRNRTMSDIAFSVPGQYCSMEKGKNVCTSIDKEGNGTNWTPDVNTMYTECLGQKNSAGTVAPKVTYGASTAQTGRTSVWCTKQDRQGKDDAPSECKDVPKDDDYVNIDSKYTGAATWNWVQTYPADRANCAGGACNATCLYTSVAWIDAPSPAFAPDWNIFSAALSAKSADGTVKGARWATWTESTWDADATLESFLVAAPKADNAILGGGIGYFIVTVTAVWFLNKRISAAEEPVY